MTTDYELEKKTRVIGEDLFNSMGKQVPSVFDRKSWTGRLMGWVMKDEGFKVRLFRFIDVLPSLKTDDLIIKLLNEYFADEENLPVIFKGGIRRLSNSRILPFFAAKIIRTAVASLARQFIAGKDIRDSQRTLKSLQDEGAELSLDLLGEIVVSDIEARGYVERYLRLLEFLFNAKNRSRNSHDFSYDISLKVSSFYSQLDPLDWDGSIKHASSGLRSVFEKAGSSSITLDMEHYYFKDLIIAVFMKVLGELEGAMRPGIALQAYLRDSEKDLIKLIEWSRKNKKRIAVRLVKGAYWDYEVVVNRQKGWPVPVFLQKNETDLNFEALTKILFENADCIYPEIATHNLRSVSHAIATADSMGVPSRAFEFQMLFGMAEPLRRALLKKNHKVRVYSPIGEFIPGMAYLIRRLLENTSNESFLRKSFAAKISFEELIKAPEEVRRDTIPEDSGGRFSNEPQLDFSRESNRRKMIDALQKIKGEFGKKYPLVIGNRQVYSDREILSFNPAAPDETVGRASSASQKEVDEAVTEARKALEIWRNVPFKERAGYLLRAAEEARKIRCDLSALEVYEAGKTWRDADGDVAEAIDYFEYYGSEMSRIGQSVRLGHCPGEENEYLYEPRGAGAVISPWNFPFAIPAGMVSASIVAGNCVIFKPSGLSPVTGSMLFEIFRKAALPPGVIQFLPGPGGEIGDYLVSHPGIDFIAFTGSKDVGLRIIEHAGRTVPGQKTIKKVIAEMGGKNAVIIDETADLDEAVRGVLESALGYQGQKCSACSRIIAMEGIFDEFARRFKGAVESVKIGPPLDPSCFMGPVIDSAALQKIRSYIEMGKRDGRSLYIGKIEGKGFFVGPAIFMDLKPESPVLTEEIFGPVIAIMKARDMDHALEIANSSVYALTGGLFSRSPENIRKAKCEFRVGNLYINRKITGALVGRQPFGGSGLSGAGSKAGGPDYLLQFMNPRSISENTLRKGFAPGL